MNYLLFGILAAAVIIGGLIDIAFCIVLPRLTKVKYWWMVLPGGCIVAGLMLAFPLL